MSKRILLSAAFVLFTMSCSSEISTEERLKELCAKLDIDYSQYDYFVFINVDACPSCSDSVRDFLFINKDNSKLTVILSSVSQKKVGFIIENYDGLPRIIVDKEQLGLKEYFLLDISPKFYAKSKGPLLEQELSLSELEKYWIQED